MKKHPRIMAMALIALSLGSSVVLFSFIVHPAVTQQRLQYVASCVVPEKACVFKTLSGFQLFDTSVVIHNRKIIDAAVQNGFKWILQAQAPDGGWGAGSHSSQHVKDPHAVQTDPATTALVGMALLRNGNTISKGEYAQTLLKATKYLLRTVENTPAASVYITTLNNTQPQVKLGRNIDVILTSQFLTNLLHVLNKEEAMYTRVQNALNICVQKIQQSQDADGSWKDGGWAPVLQSALANNALESAKEAGINVNEDALQKSAKYQKNNFDVKTNNAVTGKAAGVMLYAISGSSRASAKEAQLAEVVVTKAKKEGKLKSEDKVSKENLVKAGMSNDEAEKYITGYNINKASAKRAQEDRVMNGFGSNGGEEYLSYLMTGESLIISGDNSWVQWFEKMTSRLTQIQNNDGSWNGHHCITSPVFCTATCLLIMSVDKDIDFLVKTK